MKVAITGKGGVGKTTFASTLCRLYAAEGRTVLAADVDPDANLGLALGLLVAMVRTDSRGKIYGHIASPDEKVTYPTMHRVVMIVME